MVLMVLMLELVRSMVYAGTSFGCDDGDRTPQGQVFQATKFGIRIESIDAQDMSGYDQLSWCLILAYSVTSYDQLILASYPVFGFRHFSMCPTGPGTENV